MNSHSRIHKIIQWSLIFATIGLLAYWLLITPPGLEGKLRAIGYSVCHQIPSHSFKMGALTFPLCDRCLGMYLGVLVGFLWLAAQGKKSGLPSKIIISLFGFFVITWLIDGMNSFLDGLLGTAPLYPPTNLLRLVTGFGMGLSISFVLYELINTIFWRHVEKVSHPVIITPIVGMLLSSGILIPIILLQNEILMNIFAYLTIGTVVLLLTVLYSIFWVIILHKENSFSHVKELFIYLNAGLFCAMLQITLLDSLRLTLTKTWLVY
jgi:uncharacterized membrane protein